MPNVSIHQPSKGAKGRSAVYVMMWRDSAGKLFKKSTGTRDKSAARLIAREHERQLALTPFGLIDPFVANQGKTFADARKEYLAQLRVSADTFDVYEDTLRIFEREATPHLLRQITTATLEDYISQRLKTCSPPTANKDLRHLRAFFRWCHRRHYLRVVPAIAFRREVLEQPTVMPDSHWRQVLDCLETISVWPSPEWWRVFLSMAHELGCRKGELLKLHWSSVDLDSGRVQIKGTISKGRRDRTLPLSPALVAALRGWQGESDLVFPWPFQSERPFYNAWKAIQKAAKLPCHYRVQDLRSTCGSQLVSRGAATVEARDFLGHASVTTTERYYTTVSFESLRVASERRLDNSQR